MKIFETADEIRSWSRAEKARGHGVAFVPTMGALHEGHLSLMREGKRRAEALAVSIYVNPAQFGPGEDLARYPRDLEGDLQKCRSVGAHALFAPSDREMYPDGFQSYVSVEDVSKDLCGASRPTHFRGVATVVAKLFNMVEPDVALFGEKDFQQLAVIRRMVKDLGYPVEIVGCPTVRDPDGLAMSSRNRYLSPAERSSALSLNRSLGAAREMVDAGERDPEKVLAKVRAIIEAEPDTRIDYAKIVDAGTMKDLDEIRRPALVALAVFVGSTRLIDNTLLA
ncbi:MAG: pantoate--beta-alanine ligase [Proteobacteria bacterium]|nr:pantoate--beta-alanine ligase [Pseudomonadota bacterium]